MREEQKMSDENLSSYPTKISFPKAIREWSGKSELTIHLFEESGTDAYGKDMVDDWFKKCLEDMPKYPSWTNDVDDVIDYANFMDNWQQKWFRDFYDSSPTTKR